MSRIIVDANAVVGWLVRGEEDLENSFNRYDELLISEIAVFESVYTLANQYSVTREDIFDRISKLLLKEGVVSEHKRLINTLIKYKSIPSISFADCYFLELAQENGCKILTRDKKVRGKIKQ